METYAHIMTRRVAIVYPASVPWIARCIDGISRYARAHGGWHLFHSPPTLRGAEEFALTLKSMRGWKGDAIIAATNDARELRQARKAGIPVVNLAGGLVESHGIPRVMVNHVSAGRMAADHLLGLGLRQLAFFGWKGLWYSDQRCRGFSERARKAGVDCQVLLRASRDESRLPWPKRIAGLPEWLASLPRPCGVFAVHDYRAQLLMEACHVAGLNIPDDIALIGMDNDEIICEHLVPSLTSVSRNSEQVGWETAALLDRLMQGCPAPDEVMFVEPDRVVARQSTDKLYSYDPLAQQALDWIREHLSAPFNISALAENLGVSKRTLEICFRRNLRQSPHELITRLRVQHALTMLKSPGKRTVEQLALESGFGSPQAFRKAFKRTAGTSFAMARRKKFDGCVIPAVAAPVQYRRQFG